MTVGLCQIGPRLRDDDFPCADLLQVRQAVVEIRDSQKSLAGRLSDELARRKAWEEDAGFALVELGHKADRLVAAIGTPPDPIAGTEGTGITRLLHRLSNAQIRRTLPSLEWEPGEDTQNQSQEQIYARMRHAERVANAAEEARVSLEAEVAALKATVAERARTSERVRDDAYARAERRTRVMIAVATGGGLVAALELARWLLSMLGG